MTIPSVTTRSAGVSNGSAIALVERIEDLARALDVGTDAELRASLARMHRSNLFTLTDLPAARELSGDQRERVDRRTTAVVSALRRQLDNTPTTEEEVAAFLACARSLAYIAWPKIKDDREGPTAIDAVQLCRTQLDYAAELLGNQEVVSRAARLYETLAILVAADGKAVSELLTEVMALQREHACIDWFRAIAVLGALKLQRSDQDDEDATFTELRASVLPVFPIDTDAPQPGENSGSLRWRERAAELAFRVSQGTIKHDREAARSLATIGEKLLAGAHALEADRGTAATAADDAWAAQYHAIHLAFDMAADEHLRRPLSGLLGDRLDSRSIRNLADCATTLDHKRPADPLRAEFLTTVAATLGTRLMIAEDDAERGAIGRGIRSLGRYAFVLYGDSAFGDCMRWLDDEGEPRAASLAATLLDGDLLPEQRERIVSAIINEPIPDDAENADRIARGLLYVYGRLQESEPAIAQVLLERIGEIGARHKQAKRWFVTALRDRWILLDEPDVTLALQWFDAWKTLDQSSLPVHSEDFAPLERLLELLPESHALRAEVAASLQDCRYRWHEESRDLSAHLKPSFQRDHEKEAAVPAESIVDVLSSLGSAAVTTTPVITGQWRALEVDEAASVARAILASDRATPEQRTGWAEVRLLSVPWRPDTSIVEISLDGDMTGTSAVYLIDHEILARLEGKSPIIHRMNADTPPVFGDEHAAAAYLRFFCAVVIGEEGAFTIVEDTNLPMHGEIDDETREQIGKAVRPLEMKRGEEGKWNATASIHYSHALFRAHFVLLPTGMVEMSDDEVLVSPLPLLVDYFDDQGLRRRRPAKPPEPDEEAESSS